MVLLNKNIKSCLHGPASGSRSYTFGPSAGLTAWLAGLQLGWLALPDECPAVLLTDRAAALAGLWLSVAPCGALGLPVALCCSLWLPVALCGSLLLAVSLSVPFCGSV